MVAAKLILSLQLTVQSQTCTLKRQNLAATSDLDLTCRLEVDDFVHCDERSKQHHVSSYSRFDLHNPNALHCYFRKQHSPVFSLLEAFLYSGDGWLSSSVSHYEGGEKSVVAVTVRVTISQRPVQRKGVRVWSYPFVSLH